MELEEGEVMIMETEQGVGSSKDKQPEVEHNEPGVGSQMETEQGVGNHRDTQYQIRDMETEPEIGSKDRNNPKVGELTEVEPGVSKTEVEGLLRAVSDDQLPANLSADSWILSKLLADIVH